MKRIYLISYCIKKIENYAVFHFNGVYLGHHVKEIHIDKVLEIKKGQAYLLDLYVYDVKKQCLFCTLNRKKEISYLI
jgi:hypothetical protein